MFDVWQSQIRFSSNDDEYISYEWARTCPEFMGCDLPWVEGVSGLWTPAVVRQTEGDMTLNKCILLPLSILFTRLYTVNMKHRKCELLASAKILHNRGVIFLEIILLNVLIRLGVYLYKFYCIVIFQIRTMFRKTQLSKFTIWWYWMKSCGSSVNIVWYVVIIRFVSEIDTE